MFFSQLIFCCIILNLKVHFSERSSLSFCSFLRSFTVSFIDIYSQVTNHGPAKPSLELKPGTAIKPERPEVVADDNEDDDDNYLIDAAFLKPEVNLILDDSDEGDVIQGPGNATDHLAQGQDSSQSHVCSYCKKPFKSLSLVYKHIEGNHRDMLKCVCLFCDAAFAKRNDLIQHRRIMHGSPKDKFADFITKEEDDRYSCNECLKCYKQLPKIYLHIRREHRNLIDVPAACDVCKTKKLGSVCRHRRRRPVALTDWQCAKCGKPFHSQEQLDVHLLDCFDDTKDKTDGVFRCHFCPAVFQTRQRVTQHRKEVHPTTYYQCRRCDQNFNSKFDLMMHGRQVHNPYNPGPSCRICKASFKTLSKLKVVCCQ